MANIFCFEWDYDLYVLVRAVWSLQEIVDMQYQVSDWYSAAIL